MSCSRTHPNCNQLMLSLLALAWNQIMFRNEVKSVRVLHRRQIHAHATTNFEKEKATNDSTKNEERENREENLRARAIRFCFQFVCAPRAESTRCWLAFAYA